MKHPLHPALVHFPIATWTLATCADVAGLWSGEAAWRYAAPLHVVGSLTALAAVAAGLIDFMRLPTDSPAAKYVTRHVALVACAWLAYAASLVLRYHEHRLQDPTMAAIAASVVGFLLLGAAGWQGGQLVYRHGANVEGR